MARIRNRCPEGKRWFALVLLILMIVGATVGELPVVKEAFPEIKLDMFSSFPLLLSLWPGQRYSGRKYTNIYLGIF